MKKLLFLSIIFSFLTVNASAQRLDDIRRLKSLESVRMGCVSWANNDDVVTVDITIKNTSTTEGVRAIFTLFFWEGSIWWMDSPQVTKYFAPNQSHTFTLTGRIPSNTFIWKIPYFYALRVYGTTLGGYTSEVPIKYAEVPIYIK